MQRCYVLTKTIVWKLLTWQLGSWLFKEIYPGKLTESSVEGQKSGGKGFTSKRDILEHLMLPTADKLYGEADFIFQQDFSTFPSNQN